MGPISERAFRGNAASVRELLGSVGSISAASGEFPLSGVDLIREIEALTVQYSLPKRYRIRLAKPGDQWPSP